ncbi:MAG: DUF4399 domain-containing protein [Actinomycetota bacterium]|nr:DUF4399 domain-containing protein [Actinomycetota bacterium]
MPLADGQVIAGTPNLQLVLLAALLIVVAITLFLRKNSNPKVALVLMLVALGIGVGAVALAPKPVTAPKDVDVVIQSPADGQEVRANKPVQVKVDVKGGYLTSSTTTKSPTAGHLHFFLDGRVVSMRSTPQASLTLKPGRHTIEVEFVTPTHQPFAPPIADKVRVTAR